LCRCRLAATEGEITATGKQESRAHELHVVVYAPRDPEPKHFAFAVGETVGHAAAQAAEKFGYAPGHFSFQTGWKTAAPAIRKLALLARARPLVA
jgi:hypothetical protein